MQKARRFKTAGVGIPLQPIRTFGFVQFVAQTADARALRSLYLTGSGVALGALGLVIDPVAVLIIKQEVKINFIEMKAVGQSTEKYRIRRAIFENELVITRIVGNRTVPQSPRFNCLTRIVENDSVALVKEFIAGIRVKTRKLRHVIVA